MSAQPVAVANPRRHAVFHELRVAAIDPLTEDAVAITFEVPADLRADYDFVQGQHVSLRCQAVGDDIRRNYSICSPAGSGVLRVAVKRLADGVFSTHAHDRMRPGDVLEVMTPTGRFHVPLDPARARSYAAVAAGSGITPILSILATTLAVEPGSDFTLLYGNRTSQTIMFLEELEDLKNRYPARLTLYHVLSREQQDVELFNGRIENGKFRAFLDGVLPPATVDEWFLCGPPAMIAAARTQLVERGIPAAHVHSELFHAEGATPTAPARPVPEQRSGTVGAMVTVILDGRGSSFTMDPAGPPILDAALQVRADAPFACKGGVCGTCRARLVAGEVRMDRCYALEQSEVDEGFVLACQSHPLTGEVTLDFDQ